MEKDNKAQKSWDETDFDDLIYDLFGGPSKDFQANMANPQPMPDAGINPWGNQASTSNAHPISAAPNTALWAAHGDVYSSSAGAGNNNPWGNQGSTSTLPHQISDVTRVWGEEIGSWQNSFTSTAGPSSQKRHLEVPEAANPALDKRARQEPDPMTVPTLPLLPYLNPNPVFDIPIPWPGQASNLLPQARNPPSSQSSLAAALWGVPDQRHWNLNPFEQMGLPMGTFHDPHWNPNPVFEMATNLVPRPPQVGNPRPPQLGNPRPPQVGNRPHRRYRGRRRPRRSRN